MKATISGTFSDGRVANLSIPTQSDKFAAIGFRNVITMHWHI